MDNQEYKPGKYVVISNGNVNIRREPKIVGGFTNNIVGQHTPGTHLDVYEIFVDKDLMVWGRISPVDPSSGKANWICIYTGNRKNLEPVNNNSNRKFLRLLIDDKIVFETNLD